ncbi:MAG: hypothetical protein ACFFE5_16190, partial [Candidatus Thorarchaeota archaeon]
KLSNLKFHLSGSSLVSYHLPSVYFHWYIIADQIATKIDENSYMTSMQGIKFKVGHKRPYWKKFSYNYPEQLTYKEKVIKILEKVLKDLKRDKKDF